MSSKLSELINSNTKATNYVSR